MLHTKSTKELIIMRIKTNELDIIFSSLIPRKAGRLRAEEELQGR
jgi:hypothetical protein